MLNSTLSITETLFHRPGFRNTAKRIVETIYVQWTFIAIFRDVCQVDEPAAVSGKCVIFSELTNDYDNG